MFDKAKTGAPLTPGLDAVTTTEPAEPCRGFWAETARIRSGYLAEVPTQTLVLKVAEEVGEVAEAYIGMTGGNPCKGVHKTRIDVLDELADVMLTAAVAMFDLAGGAGQAEAHLVRRLAVVSTRDVAAPPAGADTASALKRAPAWPSPPDATC
ncbi:MazG-like family protein [Actinomadura opuntiae]|uniref:MazG-like family protein n=1 Tax=Actinomadura sp. OS1-43 TaxID=604315 RepID=UPI00255AF001|nr:MazG-like family protein [Actinomadura sp. OS1-43]MDL4814016.1 MazG-like family protein [Actinomadura sp. OS1-43]